MKEIILNTVRKDSPNYKKFKAIVDDIDYKEVNKYNWHCKIHRNTVYAKSMINGKLISMHRFIINPEDSELLDHQDTNGLNNQRYNLRISDIHQNQWNRNKNKKSSSMFKGVSYNEKANKWYSRIKGVHLGTFTSEIEAAKVYNAKALEFFGDFARLNIIPEQLNNIAL